MNPSDKFLDGRRAAADSNRDWSMRQLGEDADILDLGCAILEHVASCASDHVKVGVDEPATAIDYLAYFIAARASTVATLLLDGYLTDAGALFRSMLEAYGLQVLIEDDASQATAWLGGKQIPEKLILRAVDRSIGLGRSWGETAKVVHPNFIALKNQIGPDGSAGMHGVQNAERLRRLTVNFGVLVTRETQLMGRRILEILRGEISLEALDQYFRQVDTLAADASGR